MATRKTTCEGCFDLPSNDQGKPVNDGTPVQLCKLTRPEVKERIQEDKLPDKRTCPKCQHDVGDHVAKDDDGMRIALLSLSPFSLTPLYLALSPSHTMRVSHHLSAHPASPAMTWPPQPVGVQNQAQGMSACVLPSSSTSVCMSPTVRVPGFRDSRLGLLSRVGFFVVLSCGISQPDPFCTSFQLSSRSLFLSFRDVVESLPRRAGHPTALVPTNKHMSCSVRTGIMQAK
eukprot:TRINITY_DN42_c0_g1_i1.p1 TRINITY_DN42_c0_g1~~TRINITY_DN42_c0_g1_i1.p1  ORF type:complete len:230 (+),score=19.18 TRINITY_DN42_c0_g1_i1:1232-1921(+)